MAMPWSFFRKNGVFVQCDGCQETVPRKDVEANMSVCPRCGYHHRIGALKRIEITLDEGTFEEHFEGIEAVDPLGFVGKRSYAQRIADARERTGLKDAAVAGTGKVLGAELVIACTDFGFLMGSMGSALGEKITRAVELATERRLPVIIFSGSGGGARMDEGMLSLMQMAKTSAAIARHNLQRLLYISVITNPTYAGVAASFASLGDVIMAEPRAQTGFTGPRVIEQTMKVKLPAHFQESEFMLEHGQIDMIVEREHMREAIRKLIDYCVPADGGS